jgi:proline dehydrogenase
MFRDVLVRLSESGTLRSVATRAPGARTVARRFVAGETVEDGIAAARALNAAGIRVTLDNLGESVARVPRPTRTCA